MPATTQSKRSLVNRLRQRTQQPKPSSPPQQTTAIKAEPVKDSPNWQWGKRAATPEQKRERQAAIISVLKFCLLVGAGVCIWLNVQPYIGVMDILLGDAGQSPLIRFIRALPVIGWAIGLVDYVFTSIAGVCIWAIFQILELLPTFLMGTQGSIKQLIDGLSRVRSLPMSDSDPEFVKRLKVKHNRMPVQWLTTATVVATFAYLVDFVFCIIYYPPIKGGLENFGLFLAAPTFSDIDFKNLVLAVVTLFAVEAVVWTWMWLKNANYFMGGKGHE